MRVLVTGARGAIGKKLCEALKSKGYEAVALIRSPHEGSGVKHIETRIGNILDDRSLDLATRNIDVVIHLAGITHTNRTADYYRVNTEGTKKLLAACSHNNVARFLFISSRTASETAGAYAHSKLLAEKAVIDSQLNWTIVRLAEVYGASEREFMSRLSVLVDKFFVIPVIGDGSYRLSPVHVDDVIDTLCAAVDNEKTERRVYTIAGPHELQLDEIIDTIVRIRKVKRLKVHIPIPLVQSLVWALSVIGSNVIVKDQIPRLLSEKSADISQARHDLQFHPRSFEEGMTTTVNARML